ncbi:hypothetical protein [Halorubrum trueperi]|uniref:HPP family protein n=1 Tax=Halorubrum trueperi TaxID=2004704 RepID=A0ABD5UF19_9EURY
MSRETRSGRSAHLARIALGETGFERAAVWSAVGFACSYVAFDMAEIAVGTAVSLGATTVPQTLTGSVFGIVAALTAVGVVAFAATGGGAVPAILLAYGPFAAALLRTIGPEPYALPLAAPVSFLAAVVEPLGVSVAAAVAVGVAGYAVGRVVAGVGSAGEGAGDPSETERASEAEERADANAND